MRRVLVFGTFDIFHEGHRDFLKQAKKYGDFLRVVVARDATVIAIKGFPPQNAEQERLVALEKSGLMDEVVLGSLVDKYEAVRNYRPDIICLGYDQVVDEDELKNILEKAEICKTKIIRLKSYYPEKFKSSKLRKQ